MHLRFYSLQMWSDIAYNIKVSVRREDLQLSPFLITFTDTSHSILHRVPRDGFPDFDAENLDVVFSQPVNVRSILGGNHHIPAILPMETLNGYNVSPVPDHDIERAAGTMRAKTGFGIRHPPKPHLLSARITQDQDLFQTIHMGEVNVEIGKWLLVVDGLVKRPFALTYEQLLELPSTNVQSTHECFGSPLAKATVALWRIGNVVWTGIPLRTLLDLAEPLPAANFVWSDGLDSGSFAGVDADRYQKDLPLSKAQRDEVLVAYKLNGEPLNRARGGPVRLVVPGWFGTNSTKWLCKLSLQKGRAPGPYTTRFYNTEDFDDPKHTIKPVWKIDINSMIVRPAPGAIVHGPRVHVEGWSWSYDGVEKVEISSFDGDDWYEAALEPRLDFRWQRFTLQLSLQPGEHTLVARATSRGGKSQALSKRRNQVHRITITVQG